MGDKKDKKLKPYAKKDPRRRFALAPAGSKDPAIADFLANEQHADLDKRAKDRAKQK